MNIVLPERLQASQTEALLGDLKAAIADGDPLVLDASKVTKVDTAGLQLLVSMAKTTSAWSWAQRSEVLQEAARRLGLEGLLKLDGSPTP